MTDDDKKAPTKRTPRKRSRSKRQSGSPDAARRPDAAQRAPGRSEHTSSTSEASVPEHDQRKQAARPTATGERANALRTLATIPLHVRWRDLDAFNHVNNSSYLTFLEEARLQWLRTVPGEWFTEHAMPVMAAVELHYRKPITWPAEVDVLLSWERLGNTSITIGNRIVDRNDASCVYADGNIVMVWVDPASGAAVALPGAIRDACSSV